MDLTPGTRFGVYEIVAPIGSGGMGVVYRARDVRLGRDVALKILAERSISNPDAIARFEVGDRDLTKLRNSKARRRCW